MIFSFISVKQEEKRNEFCSKYKKSDNNFWIWFWNSLRWTLSILYGLDLMSPSRALVNLCISSIDGFCIEIQQEDFYWFLRIVSEWNCEKERNRCKFFFKFSWLIYRVSHDKSIEKTGIIWTTLILLILLVLFKYNEIENMTQVAYTTIKKGQVSSRHVHLDMNEVY